MDVKQSPSPISDNEKRTAKDVKKLKAAGLIMAASYMQGLQAAIKVYEQQQVVGQ